MSIDWKSRRTWTVLIVAFIVAVILGLLDIPSRWLDDENRAGAAHAATQATSKAQDAGPIECNTEQPCSGWTPTQAKRAWRDGRIGPKWVTVPKSVERAFRKAVERRGDRFKRRVISNMPWYQKGTWSFQCVMSIGARAAFETKLYPKCMTPKQMKRRFERINKVYVDCSGKVLIGGGVGSLLEPRKSNALVGALGTGVGCMAEAGLDAAYDSSKPYRDIIAAGFDSLTVAAARKLGY